MSSTGPRPASTSGPTLATPTEPGFLDALPTISRRQARLEMALARLDLGARVERDFGAIRETLGVAPEIGEVEILWRSSGLARTGCVAQFAWPRMKTRLALGLEVPLAHALVDRLLGVERPVEENRRQLSPVEWGILTFVAAKLLHTLSDCRGPLAPCELVLDRVGADPFDTAGLGTIVTIRWPARLGDVEGSFRLWVAEGLVSRWVEEFEQGRNGSVAVPPLPRVLDSNWVARAGTIRLARGLRTIKPGSVLPVPDLRLSGSLPNPTGMLDLITPAPLGAGLFRIPCEPVPGGGVGRIRVSGAPRRDPNPREAIAVSTTMPNPERSEVSPLDVPVTLVVELGRVNLSLERLADLRPGDVIELGRHSREPVELTSGGRVVARGELVQIDTELGVRVTSVFL